MSERIVAVIPVRSFRDGKTRLASVLNAAAREALLRDTAERAVSAARHSRAIETILVVSPEPVTLAWAAELGRDVVALQQPVASPGLNGAIDAGRDWAIAEGAAAIVSLFADLPFLAAEDIRDLAAYPEPVVLGQDRREEGTNALLLRLAGAGSAFRFAFGEGSLIRHVGEARRLALDVGLHRAPGIAFDLDTPIDWADYLSALREFPAVAEPDRTPCGAAIA